MDYFRGVSTPNTIWLDRELDRQRIGIADMILCEVLQGVKNERTFREVRARLEKLEIFDSGGLDQALAAAENYRRLRSSGRTVRRTVDLFIATFCLKNGHSLLHNDRDFDAFEKFLDLSVVHPTGLSNKGLEA